MPDGSKKEEKEVLLKKDRPEGKPEHDNDDHKSLVTARLKNEAYESACRARMWAIGVPAFATLACVLCLYTCEDCLIGVMVFCAALCFRDWVLVLVFWTSLALLVIRHPMDTNTLHRVSNAAFEFIKTEPSQ